MINVERDAALTGGVGSPEMTDAERRISDTIRHGVVKQVSYGDPSRPRVKVGIGDPADSDGYILTGWLPLQAGRSDEWNPLRVGEACTVVSEGGEIQCGVVTPAAIHSADNPAPGDRVDLWRKRFGDGTVIEYDEAAKAFAIDAMEAGSLAIRAGGCELTMTDGTLTLKVGAKTLTVTESGHAFAGDITADGNLTAAGTVTGTTTVIGGGKNLKTHTHSGVTAGGASTGAPT